MNPSLTRYIQQFEREAASNGSNRKHLGQTERKFLEQVWGPAFHYDYQKLQTEYPIRDVKGKAPFVKFIYDGGGLKLLIEIDGSPTPAGSLPSGALDAYLSKQNDLVLSGWLVLRFSTHQIEKHAEQCQRQIKQAIGHWWSQREGELEPEDADVWKMRKSLLIRMARQRNGILKPRDVADAFQMTSRAAANWLKRFQSEGVFTGVAPKQNRLTRYKLNQDE